MPVTCHNERGQTLPVAALGLIALLAFAYFAVDYGNTIRWQIRAQSAADSAAQAILTIQTQEFNEMTAVLYASSVEEYRLRRNLNAMIMAANLQGGCANGFPTLIAKKSACATVYAQLQPYFMRSVARYGNDVLAINKITATMTLSNISADSRSLINQLITQCNGSLAGDCAFSYFVPSDGIQVRTPTYAVKMDALRTIKPEYGSVTQASGVNPQLLAPIQVEVETCANVPPLLPGFFGYVPKVAQVIGRGAATAVMTEQDWLQPGTITNPFGGKAFQPLEQYVFPFVITDPTTGYDWYDLNFGGNGNHAYTGVNGGYSEALLNDEFSAQLGWWNSVPIHTFLGARSATALGCTPVS